MSATIEQAPQIIAAQLGIQGPPGAITQAMVDLHGETLSAKDISVASAEISTSQATISTTKAAESLISKEAAATSEINAASSANLANLAAQSHTDTAKTTLALLNADLAWVANKTALVTNDTITNNGIYIKLGASGAGSWQKSSYIPPLTTGSVSLTALATDTKYGILKFKPVILGDGIVSCVGNAFTIANGVTGEVGGIYDKYLVSIAPCSLNVLNTHLVVIRGYNIVANMLRPSNQLTVIDVAMGSLQMSDIIIAWADSNGVHSIYDTILNAKTITKLTNQKDVKVLPMVIGDGIVSCVGNAFTIANGVTGEVGGIYDKYLFSIAPCAHYVTNTKAVVLRGLNLTGNAIRPSGQLVPILITMSQLLPDDVVIAWGDTHKVHSIYDAYLQGEAITSLITGASDFLETNQRLLLPPKMYFVDGDDLPLYKGNVVAEINYEILDELKTILMTGINGSDRYQEFSYNAILKPEKLASTFRVGIKQNFKADYNFYSNIVKSSVPSTAIVGKNFKYMNFGDSLTSGGVPSRLKAKLEFYGATVTPVGTYADIGGVLGEGKGAWCLRQMVGKDNRFSNIPVTRSISGSSSGQWENPFLKLADATDIANHPTWCFRNTGVEMELSYVDDPIKTGNFYIWDFAWYMSAHGIAAPDVITIALGTNDIGLDNLADWLTWARLGLEIMIKQIKVALPNVKIGVIPTPSWSSSVAGNERTMSKGNVWIENCITDVISYQETYNNLHIIPIWCHMNRDWNFEYISDANTALSSINQSRMVSRPEFIHFNADGYTEYIKALSAWVLNVMA